MENMRQSFGNKMLRLTANRTVCNAGVITAESDAMVELSKDIYHLCNQTTNNQSDQSAYNIYLGIYGDEVKYASPDDAWAAQMHVHFHPESSRNLSVTYHVDDTVRNDDGKEFCIIHQYNRSSELTRAIKKRFL